MAIGINLRKKWLLTQIETNQELLKVQENEVSNVIQNSKRKFNDDKLGSNPNSRKFVNASGLFCSDRKLNLNVYDVIIL